MTGSIMFNEGPIKGVVLRELKVFVDDRGWLVELFREDEIESQFHPVMSYVSSTLPGVKRGPHEHVDQADFFCFIGPSNFLLRLWDNRAESATYRNVTTLRVGEDNPMAVLVPLGVVHAYKNTGNTPGI